MNPWTAATRTDRWEVGLPELSMGQLRAPVALRWLKHEGKPNDAELGTFALTSMFNDALIARIMRREYRVVIRQLVRVWPELLTEVQDELTVVRTADARQAPSGQR